MSSKSPESTSERYLPTSSQSLNELMIGWMKGTINTIFGEAKTGKTTLIIDAMINAYDPANKKQRFFYVDTENGFLHSRFEQIVRARNLPEEIMDRLIYKSVTSFAEQHKVIEEEIPAIIKHEGFIPGIIAIDSFINFYHHQLCGVKREYMMVKARELQGKLSVELDKLSGIARKYNCPVIVVSWPRTTFGKRSIEKMLEDVDLTRYYFGDMIISLDLMGGKRLEYLSKLVIRTARILLDGTATILVKHLARPTEQYTWFTIKESGICDMESSEMRKVMPITHLYDFMKTIRSTVMAKEEVPEGI